MAQDGDIVVEAADAGLARHPHRLFHPVDLTVALVARFEKDRPGLVVVGTARAQGDVDHLHADVVFGPPLLHLQQHLRAPLPPRRGRSLIDVFDAELRQDLHFFVGLFPELRSNVHGVSSERSV